MTWVSSNAPLLLAIAVVVAIIYVPVGVVALAGGWFTRRRP